MKRIIFTVLSLVVFLNIFITDTVHAEEKESKTYHMYVHSSDTDYHVIEFSVPSDALVFGTYTNGVNIVILHDGERAPLDDGYMTLRDQWYYNGGIYEYTTSDRDVLNTEWWINAVVNRTGGWNPIKWNCSGYWESADIPMFENFEQIADYILTGNEEGWVNKPEYDLSVEHDFNSDVWSTDIPIPELSQISHTGFTLDNWSEDYYVDIIVKNHLSRVRMMRRAGADNTVPSVVDTSPWYAEHYWNFTLHDVLASRAVVDINDVYGVDIQGALIEDFKNWSLEHPSIKDIQGYSWLYMGQADDYLAKYVYKADSSMSDEEQLKNSGQAQTEYYVRYVTLDGECGQWAHYRLRDYSYNGQGERIEVGRVTSGTIDSTGKPNNTIVGSTDSSGNIDYTPIVDTNVDVNVGELRDVLESFANGVGHLPSLIAQVFSFLPWWINAMIAGVIAICIMLRVLGR